jgi:hypothetical protein
MSFQIVYSYRADNKYPDSILPSKRACPDVVFEGKEGKNQDYTDVPVRATLVNISGVESVRLSTGHLYPNYMIGKDFGSLKKVCTPVFKSAFNKDFAAMQYNQWFSSCYTTDGINIMAIIQHDWHAGIAMKKELEQCQTGTCVMCKEDPFNCWWLALTIMYSKNGGASFVTPTWYILAQPDISGITSLPMPERLNSFYTNGAVGVYQTSNIAKAVKKDVNYYFITRSRRNATSGGYFIMCKCTDATKMIIPGAWKSLVNGEFTGNLKKGEGSAPSAFAKMSEIRHLSYNIYYDRYMIFGFANKKIDGVSVRHVAFMLSSGSDNILNWDANSLTFLFPAVNKEKNTEIRYPTLIDETYTTLVNTAIQKGVIPSSEKSERRNFDISGKTPMMYCTLRTGSTNAVLDVVKLQVDFLPIPLPS